MAQRTSRRDLEIEHRPERIRERIARPRGESALGDFVLGGVDGVITTFAVVAGSTGGRLSAATVIILGLANLVADGFSMGISNYLATRSRQQEVRRAREDEQWQLEAHPEGERSEIHEIFASKGFEGETLEKIVDTITGDPDVWVDTMMREELKLSEVSARPLRAGLATFLAFAICGFVPLLPYIFGLAVGEALFWSSAALAAATFLALGLGKGVILGSSPVKSSLQTLAIGGTAAVLAYAIGAMLHRIFGVTG